MKMSRKRKGTGKRIRKIRVRKAARNEGDYTKVGGEKGVDSEKGKVKGNQEEEDKKAKKETDKEFSLICPPHYSKTGLILKGIMGLTE
jgi:hypothetical protein